MSCGKPCNCATYRDHVASVAFAASALPTRKAEVVRTEHREAEFAKDAPAYKRLRKDGLQPDHVDGSHRLEAALS